jgi:hypothetical protein
MSDAPMHAGYGPVVESTAVEKAKASLFVASIATGPADCRQLLDVLGLLPKRMTAVHGMSGYRKGCRCERCSQANNRRNQRLRAARRTTTTADCQINTTTTLGGTG